MNEKKNGTEQTWNQRLHEAIEDYRQAIQEAENALDLAEAGMNAIDAASAASQEEEQEQMSQHETADTKESTERRKEMKSMEENNNSSRNTTIGDAIRKLDREIEIYRQAIRDAEDALADAEREMDGMLAEAFSGQDMNNEEPSL